MLAIVMIGSRPNREAMCSAVDKLRLGVHVMSPHPVPEKMQSRGLPFTTASPLPTSIDPDPR